MRELLIVDHDPWALELYQLRDGALARIGRCAVGDELALTSGVLSLHFRLIAGGKNRPWIEVTANSPRDCWRV